MRRRLLAAWLRRWFSGEWTRWLPAGDLVVLFEKLVTRVALRPPVRPAPDPDAGSGEESLRWSACLAAVGGRLARIENTLRAWPVAGAALLLLMGLILWLLAISRH